MELIDVRCYHCCDSTYVQLSKSALVCLHIVKVCHMVVLTDVFILAGNQPFFFFLICVFHILPPLGTNRSQYYSYNFDSSYVYFGALLKLSNDEY